MSHRMYQALLRSWVRAALFGALCGLTLFAVAMIWRSARHETIILQVQPLDDPNSIRAYVGGEVVFPGVYALERGSRVADAIAAAGGTTDYADISGLGMAAVVEDSDQIIVAQRRPAPISPSVEDVATPETSAEAGTEDSAAPGIIDINQAPATLLEELPGIGPKLAERIVSYRQEHGPFQSPEELARVDGISERMVEELRPLITTGP